MNLTIKPHKDACVLADLGIAAGVPLEWILKEISYQGVKETIRYYSNNESTD